MKISDISNEKLLTMSAQFGREALKARNRFVGLLPEINKRKLYEKKFVTIFHFAAVTAGVNREQVQSALNLANVFAKMPHLMNLLENGTVSVNKLRRVVSIATIENDHELAQLVQTLSKATLETFVKDILVANAQQNESKIVETEIKDGLFELQIAPSSWPGPGKDETIKPPVMQPFEYVSNPPLNNEIKKKLNELAAMDIDINDLISKALDARERDIAEQKQVAAEKAEQKLVEQIVEEKIITSVVPVATKHLLTREYGTKCAKPFCKNRATEIHHTNRFALSQIHDPHYMAPLCKQHHQIAHSLDVKSTEMRHNKV